MTAWDDPDMPIPAPPASRRRPLKLTRDQASGLTVLFLAKHALSGGVPHPTDGSHAIYHHEMLGALRATGVKVIAADSYDILLKPPSVDFVVPLLNRGGFQNSEMLAPLLLSRAGIPYLGASPMLRGLGDDKHLMKLVARSRGVATADWRVFRRFGHGEASLPDWGRMIVKPNASSASWGIERVDTRADAMDHVAALHAQGHDAIVEPWTGTRDVAVPVIGGKTPWILPTFAYDPQGSGGLRSYEEKRNLVPSAADDPLEAVEDRGLVAKLEAATRVLLPELWPFDYGRFEFRIDPATGEIWFMEVNLSCNLWSKKTIARSAASIGIGHEALVEHIVAQSMLRQSAIQRRLKLRHAA